MIDLELQGYSKMALDHIYNTYFWKLTLPMVNNDEIDDLRAAQFRQNVYYSVGEKLEKKIKTYRRKGKKVYKKNAEQQ